MSLKINVPVNINRLLWFCKHWKIGVHLILGTKRFGVNNEWWSRFDSIFGCSIGRIMWKIVWIRPLIENYRRMKFRAGVCHFMTDEEYYICFGRNKNGNHKKNNKIG